jgi:CO/xanthine dehydrogenase FAD-binding subunit
VTAITIPKPAPDTASSFAKLGARKYLVISIVMLAIVIEPEDGRVASARLALGACSPVAQRLPALEAALTGRALDGKLGETLEDAHLEAALAPIDDIRASASYRREAAATLIRRGLCEIGAQMEART